MMWVEFAAAGVVAGLLAGYLGIGGGLVLVPVLTWLFTRDPATAPWAVHMAVATSLSTMLVTSLSSVIAHHRRGAVDWSVTRSLAPGLVVGAIAGAVLADGLGRDQLATVFGTFALLAGVQLMIGKRPSAQRPLPGIAGRGVVSLVIGAVSSMVGIGGGSMTAPWLMWHGVIAQRAVATAAACGYPIALAGTATFVLVAPDPAMGTTPLGYVSLPAFLGVAVFSSATAPLGAALVHRSRETWVRRAFGLALLLVAARMLA